jgi:hypothetical protein
MAGTWGYRKVVGTPAVWKLQGGDGRGRQSGLGNVCKMVDQDDHVRVGNNNDNFTPSGGRSEAISAACAHKQVAPWTEVSCFLARAGCAGGETSAGSYSLLYTRGSATSSARRVRHRAETEVSASNRSTSPVTSSFSLRCRSGIATLVKPACTLLTLPSRPRKNVAGNVLRLTA